MPQYNGDNDPFDHLEAFNVQMDLQTSSSLAKCRAFPATLGDIPRAWLRRLHPRSICSWEECQKKFINQYRSLQRQLAPTCHLAIVFQRFGESLKDYIERFRREVNNVESPSDESIITAISAGLRKDGKLYESIYKFSVRDLDEFYERAAKEVRWEEAFSLKMPSYQKKGAEHIGQSKKRADEDSRKKGRERSPNDQAAKKARFRQGNERLARQGRYENYSILSDSQDRILATERNKEDFGRPNPLKTHDKYRTKSKFCAYHNEVGYTTSECWALKDAIEELIRRGRLRDYVVRPRDQQPKQLA
ncbi:uncharacterized protein LOC127803648 [Diospyros lotus]|uniref:uncharacterized protein LOC127803648 n=1 Tax=Diospyros lotus TaxID=55363 RepID=UPI00224E48BD|nr:uncharacterized protein LOC127803648 [Diospyros lotus]